MDKKELLMVVGGMQKHQTIKKDGICPCLVSSMGMGGGYVPMILLKKQNEHKSSSDAEGGLEPKIMDKVRIRKLTPKECWRLMGFNDEDFEKAKQVNSDSQLYKEAGNSIVVNVLMAIFKEMM